LGKGKKLPSFATPNIQPLLQRDEDNDQEELAMQELPSHLRPASLEKI
jgi:hypothetical protein